MSKMNFTSNTLSCISIIITCVCNYLQPWSDVLSTVNSDPVLIDHGLQVLKPNRRKAPTRKRDALTRQMKKSSWTKTNRVIEKIIVMMMMMIMMMMRRFSLEYGDKVSGLPVSEYLEGYILTYNENMNMMKKYMWRIYVANICGKHMWQIVEENISGPSVSVVLPPPDFKPPNII